MKKLWGLALVLTLLFGMEAQAQDKGKIGYVSKQEILLEMPQKDSVSGVLEQFRNELSALFQEKQVEYETKLQKIQREAATMSPAILELRKKEMQEAQLSLQNTSTHFEQQLAQKEQDMLKPLVTIIDNAIKAVAIENGYSHIIDNTAGIIAYAVDNSDISDLVKIKLGIKK